MIHSPLSKSSRYFLLVSSPKHLFHTPQAIRLKKRHSATPSPQIGTWCLNSQAFKRMNSLRFFCMTLPPSVHVTSAPSLELHLMVGMLKKAASGVPALLPCSRTGGTLRASKRLRPCWTDFFDHSLRLLISISPRAFLCPGREILKGPWLFPSFTEQTDWKFIGLCHCENRSNHPLIVYFL